MNMRFPLKDVTIEVSTEKREVQNPVYTDGYYTIGPDEFSMDVYGVGWYFAGGGNHISINPYPGSDNDSIELYLNGSAYGAILHQRRILPMHGSCFLLDGRGIMICGDTGAGKSSLTAAFCLHGAGFLTDDVTPVIFKEGVPYIWALSDRIKLWRDTLDELGQEQEGLSSIDGCGEKFYYPMESSAGELFRLDMIYILGMTEKGETVFEKMEGAAAFQALRNEIYRLEYLKGIPENEAIYFRKILDITNNAEVFSVQRALDLRVTELMRQVRQHISQTGNG
ncbi:MAG: hypothetical protein IH591_14475 [Bacteroidales bacterium]|nr:hypothetical protein [Bacteroidales bacterium]